MFGSKASQERTFLLLDIESGSTAAALVRLSTTQPPKLFGESRVFSPVDHARSVGTIFEHTKEALKHVVHSVSTTASRLRAYPKTAPIGTIDEVHAFFASPFAQIDLSSGAPSFVQEANMLASGAVRPFFGDLPLVRHTFGGSLSFAAKVLSAQAALMVAVHGELSEIAHVTGSGVRSYATLPIGAHTTIRTLRTHAGVSEGEARSALRLPFASKAYKAPSSAFAREFGLQVSDVARDLLVPGALHSIYLISPHSGDYFAQALAHSAEMDTLFPEGGEVHALKAHHLAPYVAAHTEVPDLPLMLHALFVDQL